MVFSGSVIASGGVPTTDRYANTTNYNQFHPSAAETLAYTSAALDCSSGRFGMIVFDLTSISGTSLTVLVEEYDIASTKWIQVAASSALTGATTLFISFDEQSAAYATAASGQALVIAHPLHGTNFRLRTTLNTVTTYTFSAASYMKPQ